MNNEERGTVPPPYLSVAKLNKVLELVKTRTMSSVSTAVFAGRGFNNSDAALAVSALKFLGAINDKGEPTPLMEKLRFESEEKSKQAFKEIVLSSYSKLFESVKDPHNLPRADLADEFRVLYSATPRIVETAVPVFLRLCEIAGLKERTATRKEHVPRTDPRVHPRPKMELKTRDAVRKGRVMQEFADPDFHLQAIVKGKMTITIPEDVFFRMATDDTLNDDWRTVLKAAHVFAKTHIPNNETPVSEEVGE